MHSPANNLASKGRTDPSSLRTLPTLFSYSIATVLTSLPLIIAPAGIKPTSSINITVIEK
jgi:hypothetical protein